MRHRDIALAVSACSLLALAGEANAGFAGAAFRFNEQATFDARALGGDLNQAQVYDLIIAFDDPGNVVLNIFDADVGTSNGSLLYQDGFGGNFAPQSSSIGLVPSLAYDSFVTLNERVDNTSVSTDPDFAFTANGFTGGWFNSNPPNGLGAAAFNSDTGLFETLVAQVTLQSVDVRGYWFGDFGLTWTDGLVASQLDSVVNLLHPLGEIVPSPGAVGLLGLAGIGVGVRRNR